MALLETREKTANSLGFRRFSLNPGIATNYHLLLAFLYPVVARYKWNWPFPASSFHLVNGVIDQVEACKLPRSLRALPKARQSTTPPPTTSPKRASDKALASSGHSRQGVRKWRADRRFLASGWPLFHNGLSPRVPLAKSASGQTAR